MSNKMTFQRNLIALEDLLLGEGSVTQTRGTTATVVTKINAANFPYSTGMTLQEKIESLDSTQYVDGDNLPVYIATPIDDTDLNLVNVIWIKEISGTENEVYYYDKLMFKYNPTAGDLIIDPAVFAATAAQIAIDYAAADDVVTAALTVLIDTLADTVADNDEAVRLAFQAADEAVVASLELGTASRLDVGTTALKVVQLNADAKLPAVDGSLLTNLPLATAPSDSLVQRKYSANNAVTAFSSLIPRAGSAPANTVGTEFIAITITPKGIGNKLLIRFNGSVHTAAVGVAGTALLFIDGVFVKGDYTRSHDGSATYPHELAIVHEHVAADLDPIVVSIRVGPSLVAGDIRFNDNSWGASGKGATLVIEEVKA